jgi:hypothetical protein
MTDLDEKEMKLFGKDILVKHRNMNDFTDTPIRLLDDEHKTDIKYFEILKTGPDVTELNEGDVVILPWARVMVPFLYRDERVTITNEDEVWGVIEDDD